MKEIRDRVINFNYGQKLSPDHLNSIIDYSRQRDSIMQHILDGAEGVVEGFLQDVKVTVAESDAMTLSFSPGAAINAKGEVIVIPEPILLSLRGVASKSKKVFKVFLYSESVLESSVNDEELPELRGYQYRTMSSKLRLSSTDIDGAIELARVTLDSSVKQLQVTESNNDMGSVNTSFRGWVRSFNRSFIDYHTHQKVKNSIRVFRALLVQLDSVFPELKKMNQAQQRALLIEAEVIEPFFLSRKVHFLLNELKKSFLDLLEEVRKVSDKASQSDSALWTSLFSLSEKLASGESRATVEDFLTLKEMDQMMRESVLNISTEATKRLLVQEAIRDIMTYPFGYHHKHSFGGVIFKKIDEISSDDFVDKITSTSEFSVVRSQRVDKGEGKVETLKGQFFTKGSLEFKLDNLSPEKDCIVLLQNFKRRGVQEHTLLFNGEKLDSKKLTANDHVNKCINLGVLVPGNSISSGSNTVNIQIENTDLDFGLFSIVVYQEQGVEEI